MKSFMKLYPSFRNAMTPTAVRPAKVRNPPGICAQPGKTNQLKITITSQINANIISGVKVLRMVVCSLHADYNFNLHIL
jgi:hypothetical protein